MGFLEEIQRRRTFGIISHPDAGKTTLTEKLLLFGGAIQEAGAVKNNKIKKGATSILFTLYFFYHKIFFRNYPTSGNRWKITPFIIGSKSGRSISSHGAGNKILISITISS